MKQLKLTFLFILYSSGFVLAQADSNQLVIAFGSCNRQNMPQPMWKVIEKQNPDVWVWLGDNIYGDSNDTSVLRAKYNLQLNQSDYKKFKDSDVKIIGTWDDHDFGRNDAGKNYPYKKESQQLALDFLGEEKQSARRNQEGIYAAYNYTVGDKKVKVLLLDARYHRDTLYKDANKKYILNTTGDILGEAQWKWLKEELENSDADVHILGSGIQMISEEHPYEKWANFPAARKKLFDMLSASKLKSVFLISGDRHIGEFSKIQLNGIKNPVFDITSSGLTHSATNNTGEANKYRVGPLVNKKHFGLFKFSQENDKLNVSISLIGEDETFHTEIVSLD